MSNVPILGQSQKKEPEFRLLYCFVCNTMEELPPFDGPPEQDALLQISCEVHTFPSGDPHKGRLFNLPVRAWATPDARKEIIDQIKGGGSRGLAEVDETFYDSRSTFMEDAMKCYQAHRKPADGCPDWKHSSKLLVPNTVKERRKEGMEKYENSAGAKTYLCQFCPVAIAVEKRKQTLLGL